MNKIKLMILLRKYERKFEEILNNYIKIKFRKNKYTIYKNKITENNKFIYGYKIVGEPKLILNENQKTETNYIYFTLNIQNNEVNYKVKIVYDINIDNEFDHEGFFNATNNKFKEIFNNFKFFKKEKKNN